MTDETENPTTESQSPLVETADLFYGTTEVAEAEPVEAQAEAEPTEEANTTDKEPEVSTEESEEISNDDNDTETEGSEDTKPEEQKFDNSEMYVEINGKDVSVEQLLEWESKGLRQSDYTKKTQVLAEERRAYESDRDGVVNDIVSEKISSYKDNMALMEVLIAEADNDQYGDPINWSELRKDDIEEYDRLKAIKDKRVSAVEAARNTQSQTSNESIQASAKAELVKLTEIYPQWVSKGKQTKAYDDDMKMIKDELDKAGISESERGGMLVSGQGQWIIDACRWRQSKAKVEKVKAKVKKLPITTKPKKGTVAKSRSAVDVMYGN